MNAIDAEQFESYRPLMFSIAYRMLGSVGDAEDMVQKTWLRYQAAAPESIVSHKAFLSTIITRLCLNHLQSARSQRETYIGPWLPEPLLTETDESLNPAQSAELSESLSLAFLSLLEQLTPLERAVFLLREVFDYPYDDIARMIGKEEAACRQLLSRAKKHIADQRPRFKPSPEDHQHILGHFIRAIEQGEIEALTKLLTEDVTLWADGGGKIRGALLNPLHGREAVLRFLLASPRLAPEGSTASVTMVNGQPSMVLRSGDETRIVVSISVNNGRVCAVHVVGNPDKLKAMNQGVDNTQEEQE